MFFVTDAIYHKMNISMNNHRFGEYFGETFSEASNKLIQVGCLVVGMIDP